MPLVGYLWSPEVAWYEIPCVPMGDVECKGVHFPMAVYSPESMSKA